MPVLLREPSLLFAGLAWTPPKNSTCTSAADSLTTMPAELLEEYIRNFFGYGSWTQPVWFVGMEEGGSADTLQARLDQWKRVGHPHLMDLPTLCHAIGDGDYFPPAPEPPASQPTWNNLTKLFLAIRTGQPATVDSVQAFGRVNLGRNPNANPNGFALIELFPLPKPDLEVWPYGHLAGGLHYLINRDTYRHCTYAERALKLRRMLQIYRPKCVVFYGLEYRDLFEAVAGDHFVAVEHLRWTSQVWVEQTLYIMIRHVGEFTPNRWLLDVGRFIRQRLTAVVANEF